MMMNRKEFLENLRWMTPKQAESLAGKILRSEGRTAVKDVQLHPQTRIQCGRSPEKGRNGKLSCDWLANQRHLAARISGVVLDTQSHRRVRKPRQVSAPKPAKATPVRRQELDLLSANEEKALRKKGWIV